MKKRELGNLGIPRGEATRSAGLAVQAALAAGSTKDDVRASIKALLDAPESYFGTRGEPLPFGARHRNPLLFLPLKVFHLL